MTEINNCENCHHYNSLIHWEEGLFHQCMRGNKLWEKCNDYDAIEELWRMTKRFINHDDIILDTEGEQLISTDEIADKMNELHEENQSLKKQNKRLHDDLHKVNQIAKGY